MNDIRLEFINAFPKNEEKEVRKLIAPFLRIVQRDISRLRFELDDESKSGSCIRVKRRYHIAHIWIGPGFFLLEKWEQDEMLIHELMHILVDIFYRDVLQVVEAYWEDDSATRNLLNVRFEDSMEKLNDALALAFVEIFNELNVLNSGWDA